jgi:PTS system D-glucosamine-specific IIA component/PTS system glucose-specific IIA component
MFEFFKKAHNLIAAVDGKVIDLSQVPDQVFAERLAGDGAAIDAVGDTIVAPADGTISLIFRTNHAFGINLDDGVELLVHIGLDTVALEGLGFERIAEEGQKVKAGDPIIKIDREFIISKGYSLITPILITNPDIAKDLKSCIGDNVKAGRDIMISYKIK